MLSPPEHDQREGFGALLWTACFLVAAVIVAVVAVLGGLS